MSVPPAPTRQDVAGHHPGVTYDDGPSMVVPCECGRKFTGKSPSAALSAHTSHARQEQAKLDRKKESPADDTPKTATPPARVKICGCGCGGQLPHRAGGLFLSGHDARFKSILARAQTQSVEVRHPATGELGKPLDIADWLDERRGGGTFWHDKVSAGMKVPEPKAPRVVREQISDEERGRMRAVALIEALDQRRPASGDTGTMSTRDGQKYRCRVVRRQGDLAVQVHIMEGPMNGESVVVPDDRFSKDRSSANTYR